MAYGLKYQTTFHNVDGTPITVQIEKRDYTGAVADIRVIGIRLTFNYQDNDTAIAGTGVKINVDAGGFDTLRDLLTSGEKEFLCKLYFDSALVFQGFSLCDLNEQQLLDLESVITIQFTDYMRRLEDHFATAISNIADYTSYIEILQEALATAIGVNDDLYVNSTLFEDSTSKGGTDTFLEQIYVENNAFYSDEITYENTYDVINKLLKPMGAFLYSSGGKWIIERHEDITRTGDWVYKPSITGAGQAVTSLVQTINRQDDDFKYTEMTQKVEYTSGLQKLIIDLRDHLLDTFIFNNYDPDNLIAISDNTPDAAALDTRQWYIHENAIGMEKGYGFRGMNSYLKWAHPAGSSTWEREGLYYCFDIQFHPNSEDIPTELSVNFSISADHPLLMLANYVEIRFSLRIDEGPYAGYYINPWDSKEAEGTVISYKIEPTIGYWTKRIKLEGAEDPRDNAWQVSLKFALTDNIIVDYAIPPTISSLWVELGKPVTQKFIMMFWPAELYVSVHYSFDDVITYIGDVSVVINKGDFPNKLTYYVNEDFIKTEQQDLHLFDLDNVNFNNGLLCADDSIGAESDDLKKTTKWVSEDSPTAMQLVDIYAKNKFRNYVKTIHRLVAEIKCSNYLKPFTIITDDHLQDGGNNIKFILQEYSWDLINALYNISAEEYTDEEITLDGYVTPISEATGVPTGLAPAQPVTGGSITVAWDAVTGATGYRVQRAPVWYDGDWVQAWKTIYVGANTACTDHVETEGTPTDGMGFLYKVCSYNSVESSAYSDTETCNWYA
jgi:hypothetical protein